MEKFARFMERFWLALAIGTAGLCIYLLAANGWDRGKTFLWLPFVCVCMWLYRRFTRRKMAEWAARERQAQDRP